MGLRNPSRERKSIITKASTAANSIIYCLSIDDFDLPTKDNAFGVRSIDPRV